MIRIIARNSAPISRNSPAALTKARMRNSTEWTGFLAEMTASADPTRTVANIQKKTAWSCIVSLLILPSPRLSPASGGEPSPIWRVDRNVARQLPLPALAVPEEPILVVEQLLACLGRKFEVRPLDDGVYRACLLAHAAVDAFRHVDVVARRAARAVIAARAGLDRDRLRRADRLAELAGDAALFPVRVAAQSVFSPEARRERRLLVRIVQRRLRLEHVADRQRERREKFRQEQRAGGLGEPESHAFPLTRDVGAEPGELEHRGHQDDHEERDRQKDFPAEPH